MSTETKTQTVRQPTLKQLHAAAVKRWGKKALVEFNPKRPDAAQREANVELLARDKARREEVRVELKKYADLPARMLVAAKFVCDVNGDEPSMGQLRAVVAECVLQSQLRDEAIELDKAIRSRQYQSKRYTVGTVSNLAGIPMCVQEYEADTAAELMEKIQGGAR